MVVRNSQEKLEGRLGAGTPEIASEEVATLKNNIIKAEDKFNKKVDIKSKLKALGLAVVLGTSSLSVNAQENITQSSVNTVGEEQSSKPEVRNYSYYEDKANSNDYEYRVQLNKSLELYKKLEHGKMGYTEAKSASEHILSYPEGVYNFYQAGKKAVEEDAEMGIMRSKSGAGIAGHPKLTEGEDFNFIGNVSPRTVVPLTDEYKQRLEQVENNSVKQGLLIVERNVSSGILKSISKDTSLTTEVKDSLMRSEIQNFFSSIDAGRYDTSPDRKDVIKNRNNWKKQMIKDLKEINPDLSKKLSQENTSLNAANMINQGGREL